jgi:hypothetical protein
MKLDGAQVETAPLELELVEPELVDPELVDPELVDPELVELEPQLVLDTLLGLEPPPPLPPPQAARITVRKMVIRPKPERSLRAACDECTMT